MNCLPLAFFAGGPGTGELALIFLVVLVIFGPKRLPEIARMIGKVMHDLRHASQDFKDQIMNIEADVSSELSAEPPAEKALGSGGNQAQAGLPEEREKEQHDTG